MERHKANLVKALEQIDEERKGTVRLRVLLNLMECMDFKLGQSDVDRITNDFTALANASSFQGMSKKQQQFALVHYRDVLS